MIFGCEWNNSFQSDKGIPIRTINENQAGAETPKTNGKYLKVFFMYCGQDASGKLFLKSNKAVEVRSTNIFLNGKQQDCLKNYGVPACWNMTNWKGLLGTGKVLMAR